MYDDMFVRIATRRNKDGSAVRYVQLVQNEWDPAARSPRMRVVHSFGREDQLDRAAVERLAGSLGRLLGRGQHTAGAAPELAYAGSVAFGGTYLLHWAGRTAHIDQLPATTDDACYRAMDWLHQARDALERQVSGQVAAALNLEVDLLFFDYPANQVRDLALAA